MKKFFHLNLRRVLFGVVLAVLPVSGSVKDARGQPDAQLAKAKKLFLEAQAFYLKQEYVKAAQRFLQAFDAKPFAAFMYNVAVAFEKARKYQEALKYFGKYLDLSPKSKDAPAIRKRMVALKKLLPPPPGLCNQNDDCNEGQLCQKGKCVAAPRPPAKACQKDEECGKGQVCKAGKCRPAPRPAVACQRNDQCAKGQVCKAGKCQAAPRAPVCQKDAECTQGKVCIAGRCRKPPAALPELKPKGLVVIDSKPRGATIWLNNKMKPPVGRTPYQASLDEGSYTVIVEQKGYKPEKRKIDVRSDRLVDLYFALSREHYLGWIQVTSNIPGASVYIDNLGLGAVGRTPYTGFRKPGMHTIWVRKPGYETARKLVEVVSGKTHTTHLTLKKVQYGWLRVGGKKTDGASVRVDGKEVCKAPCKAVKVPSGGHVLKIKRKGYKPIKKVIRVEQGKFTLVNAKMAKKPTRISAYVTYGFAAATLGVAIFAVIKGDAIKDAIERDIRNGKPVNSKDPRFKKGKIWYIVGDSLFGVAAIAAGFALYYTFIPMGPKSKAEIDVRGVAVTVTPQVGPGTVALSGRWRF